MNAEHQDHQQVWDLLPWLANGTADAVQTRRAESHLRHCAACRAELLRERRLAAGLGLPAEHAPDVELGLQRLAQRLDHAEPAAAAHPPVRPRRAGLRTASLALIGIGLVELLALAALVLAGWRIASTGQDNAAPAFYRTLSEARPAGPQARLRLIFDPSRPVGDLQALLQSQGLVVVDGPSAAGVWSLGIAGSTAPDADAIAQALRHAPGVTFAEALAQPEAP